MVPQNGTRELFAALKAVLKARGLTYADVAAGVGMSESGVKKIFSVGDCSLTRLAAIADVADVSLGSLFELASRPPFERIGLSEVQQRALLEAPRLFAFYWKLAIERWELDRIRRTFALEEAQVRRWLRRLDGLDLVQVGVDDRIRLPHGDLVRWIPEGPLLDHLYERWSRDVIDRCLQDGQSGLFRLHYVELRPETAAALEAELTGVLDRGLRQGRTERLTGDVDPWSVLVGVAPGSFVRQM